MEWSRKTSATWAIVNWNRFDAAHFMTDAQIDEWVATTRHKVMYKDAQNVD